MTNQTELTARRYKSPINHSIAGYAGIHYRIRNALKKPDVCCLCGKSEPIEVHNLDSKYSEDPLDWVWVCRSCHMWADGRRDYYKTTEKYKKHESGDIMYIAHLKGCKRKNHWQLRIDKITLGSYATKRDAEIMKQRLYVMVFNG